MPKIKATILILDYMKADGVVRNVGSIKQQSVDFEYKIIVMDNSCDPANASRLLNLSDVPGVTVQINTVNTGYIKAHNDVSHLAEGDYIFIVNPDIWWVENDTMQKLVDYMKDNPDIGILGPRLNKPDGSPSMTARPFPRLYRQVARRTWLRNLPLLSRLVAEDEMRDMDYDKTQEVDWLHSSFIVMRADLWRELGGFDERYFLFMGDVELCWQAWKAGYRVVYWPKVALREDGRRLSRGGFLKLFSSWTLRQHVVDSIRFRLKHLLDRSPRAR